MNNEERKQLLLKMLAKKKQESQAEVAEQIVASHKEVFPLSMVQRGIWLDCQMDPDTVVYNIPFACKIKGAIHIEALKEGIRRIIARHDIWRTVLIQKEEDVFQKILPEMDLDFRFFDKRNQKYTDEMVAEEAKAFVSERFDVKSGPLVRFALYQTEENLYYFILSGHHLVYDGTSENLFCQELSKEYSAAMHQRTSSISDPSVSYGDYAEFVLAKMESETIKTQIEYWEQELSGIEPTEFPTDYSRPAIRRSEGGMIYFDIPKNIEKKARQYAQAHHVTMNVVLHAALNCLLHIYSRSKSIAVEVTVANRENVEVEKLLGCFINNLIIVTEMNPDMSFNDLVEVTREKIYKAFENKDVPLEKLVEVVKPARELSRAPFSEVGFNYNPRGRMDLELEGCESEAFGLGDFVVLTDVNFQIHDDDEALYGFVEFNKSIYTRKTLEKILERYFILLEKLADSPDEKLDKIEVVSEEERQQILVDFNSTAVVYPSDKTIVDLFEEQVKKSPDSIAVVYEGESLTYSELNTKANRLARVLREKYCVKPDDFVAVMCERSLEMIVAMYGVMKAGGAYVPVDPTYPDERITYMLEDSKPKAVLTYKASVKTEVPVIDLGNSEIFVGSSENLVHVNTPENVIYCIYTSGTTGKPKGVMIKHRNVVNYSYASDKSTMTYAYENKLTKFVSVTNMTFDIFVTEAILTLCNGMTAYIANSEQQNDLEQFEKLVADNELEILQTTPSRIKGLFAQDPDTKVFSKMKYIMLGGEAVTMDVVRKLKDSSDAVIENVYGPSETTVWSSCLRIDKDYQNIPVGKPIANTQIYIVNKDALCGIGVPGELCIAGDGLARGYLNRPELTAEKFVKNPYGEGRMYHTGDLARWLLDGNIEYLGRIDDQVKIRGFRIELGEIESRIREIKEVKDCAVIVRTDSNGDKELYAYVVGDEEISPSMVRDELAKNLPDYMIPSYLMQIESIPVNKSGKLDRKALPDIEAKTENEYVAPRNETEEIICAIFGEILNLEKVSVKDSFFVLGGHSLRATRLVNRIEAETGKRIALKDVFGNPTPEKLSELVTGSLEEEYVSIPKAEEKEYYPMSSAQKRTYLICQMDTEDILYNIPQHYRLTGSVDPKCLKEAFQKVIDRHEILRTVFEVVDGEPMQRILDHVDADVEFFQDKEISEKDLIVGFLRPFDLGQAPLVRARLVEREGYYLLSIDMHHIVGDAMSAATFIRELNAVYNGNELEPITHQFKDYSEWMAGRDLSGQAAYWKDQFDDEIPVLDMPLDFPRPQDQSSDGLTISRTIGKNLGEKIQKLASQTGTTDFMILLSSAMVLLGKYSRQEDIVIGTPISGRTHKDTEKMLGMFINTLAMRGRPEGKKTYLEFLSEIKETCLRAYENQEYPFEELVEAVDVVRDMSRNPLFDVMLDLHHDYENENIKFRDANTEWIETEESIAKFDLTFDVKEKDGNYEIALEYCTALFTNESAWSILNRFVTVVETLLDNPEIKISDVKMTDEEEEKCILSSFNRTEAGYSLDQTAVELFEEQVEKNPDHVAVVFRDETLTFRELNEKANQLAHILREKYAVQPNDFVAILAERSMEMIVAIYGILKSGGAYLPIDPEYPEDRIQFMLEDSAPKAILTYKAQIETQIPVIDLADSTLWTADKSDPSRVNNADDLAYCIFTSGTTGKPKGALLENRGLIGLIRSYEEVFNMSSEDRMLQFASYCFDQSVGDIFGAMLNGATLYVVDDQMRYNMADLEEYMKKEHITVASLTPKVIREINIASISDLRLLDSGGEAAELDVLSKIVNSGKKVINSYGPTEATVNTTYAEITLDTDKAVIGKPSCHVQVYIMQGDVLCGIGVPGELCITGDGVARGYLNRPELTAEKFVKNPFGEGRMYRSGDLARWLPDGNIEYLGRIDEQVKIRGFRVELGEIENRIRELENIKNCAVIARNDATGAKAIYAYLVSDEELNISQIKDELGKTLPDYMVPSYMMRIESIPVTRNGKLDKRALPDIEIKTSSEYVAPRNDEEKALCEAFKAMLGVEKVSVKDSFFELGGDSIKAIRVVSDMRSRGYTITVKDILNRRTPETIALYVTKAEEESYEQGEVTGIVTETPVIRDFRYCQMRRPEHYNQAMMVPVESDRDSICHALDALVLHHDILRAVYVNDKLEILGYENSKKYEISEYDVRGHVDVEKEIEKLCSEEQAHIDLKNGPLMRVALFETDFGKYMMMCIHHLAVDGVSWRILLEDFDSALEAVKSGKDVKLPAKTASFIEWSKALDEYRSSEELLEEKSFWNEFEMHKDENRLSIPEGVRSETINRYKTVKLSEEITENLLRRAGYAYNTQINDLLLASLGIAIGKLTGQEAVSVGVEGHGRESIHKPINIDRTVGWFTSMYPVELGCSGNTETTIVETKDMLHEVPNNGLGYELLYDTDLGSCVDVYFNYLGEIDSENQNEKKSFSVGECVSPENRLPGIFSINSWVENKQFVCEICSNLCSDAYADEFAKLYLEAVTQVVSWCVSQKKQHITESDMYGLTPLQEGMYFHNELDHEDQSYRIQESFKANMRVEISSLQISLDCLAEKYDVLKTSFAKTRKGEIRQYIDPDKCIEICEVKYEQVFSVDLLKEYSEKDLKRGFNLKTDSLLRVAVLSFADFDVLFFSSHHLIIDGWCTPIVYEDLVRFYNLCLSGTDKKTLSEMVKDEKRFILPFREYVEWLGRIKKSDVEKFWNTYLEEYDSVAEIQPVEKVVNVPDAAVLEKMIVLDPELTAKLGSLAKNCNSTISSVMQMIFGLLLQKHCGLDDVLVGNVVSGRNVPLKGIENAVGMFINTVPLRIHTESTEDTIKELLIRLQTSNNESNSYDSVSLGELNVAGSQVSEYIKHLFVFENYPGTDETSEETQFAIEELYTREQTNYSITMCAFMLDDKMAVRFSYDPKSYTAGNIDLLLTHLKTIADRVAEDPERKVSELCISDENEKEQVLHAFNNTSFDYPKETTIVELFEKRVSDCPDAIALEMGEQTLTYAQLNEKANQLAHILREKHGVKPNDFVAILAERSMEMIVGIYGIIKAGGAYVPMDPTYPEDRIAYMLEDSKTKAVLTYKTSIKTDIPVIDLEDQELYSEAKENLPIVNAADDLIYCIYTSGTTGKPKGVMIENRSLNNYLLTVGKKFYIYEGIVPLITNYVFDLTVTAIIGSLLLEKTLRIFKTENELARYASEKDVAVLKITPSHLSLVMEESEKYGVCKIHALMLGGEAVTKNLVTRIKDKLGEDVVIINEYGPTEATVATTYSILERDEDITIGKPFYNTQIHIVSGNALCGIGVPGELCIAGDPVAKGYLNRPELTTEKFVKNPYGDGRMYHTGDLARWLPDGNIECLGRIDEQVKIRGFRIELGEIESRIREITDVKDCAVIARTDASGDKALYAYIVSDNEVQVSEIREELSKNLPEYMIPSYLMQIERIPITRNGKLDKRALPDIEAKTGGEYVAPRNDTEETLCEIFGEILNVEKVSVKDSFFALGGHSLRATRLVNRIEAETGTRIALKDIFSNPTPEKLAEMISKEETTEYVSIPKAEEKEFYPMSSAQQRTYLICQMDPDGILYNMSQNLIIKGDVQPERLKQALQKVMDRHEILRTVFLMVDGQPVQKILDHVEADFSYTEELVSSDAELISEFTRPFDLSKAPLVRIGLVKRNGYFLLNIDMHHIVGDGMSVGTFTKELNAFYNGEEVAPLTHQFKDYSEWMRTRDLSGQAEYWKSQFDEEVPVLDMPLDFARPQVQSNKGAMIYRNSGRELGERIKKLAAKTESTDFMVLLSSLMVLLSKYSRQEDIVVGTPISGRTHKDTESMMGMFINTLAMRGRPEGKKSYLEFLSEIKETSLKAYENQEYPFEELVEAVDVVRDMSRNPLFDVMLVLQNNEEVAVSLGGNRAEWAESDDTIAKLDLGFDISENDSDFTIGVEYCTDLFTKDSIQKLVDRYLLLLEKFTDDPSVKLESIELLREEEKNLILNTFNDTRTEYSVESSFVALFEEEVRKHPDHTAVVFENESLTYAELNAKANQVALKLRDLGVKRNDLVSMLTERSLEMIVGIFGIMKAGGAYLPMDPTYPEDRIAYMLEDSSAKAILTYKSSLETEIPVIDLGNSDVFNGASENLEPVNTPDDLLYCIYTSGTTGKPKGVLIEHRNACNLARYMQCELGINETDHILLFANYIFDGSVWEILTALVNGAALYIPTDETIRDIDAMKCFVSEKNITVSYFPPQYYEQGRFELGKYVITAGSAASMSVVESVLENSGYINSYGPTEATVCISNWILRKGDKPEKITIGKPISNVQVYIVQGDTLCGVGVPGELCASGAGIARGYLNRPELTAEKFVKNPYGKGKMYHTGDLARWLPDGSIEYLGRIDEQIKIRGFRVELGEIDSRIREMDLVKDCAVIARSDANGDKAICAYVVGDEEINVSQIRDALSKSLPDYMIPSYMMQIEAIPMTRNGKLDKRALPEIEARTSNEYVAPRTKEEEVICEAFQQMLGAERVSVNDSFFDLGGDSIKAIRVVSAIRSMGFAVSVKDILNRRTPENIAPFAEKAGVENYEQGEVTGKVTETPVMRNFRSWNFAKPMHFNQSTLLSVDADSDMIRAALEALVLHHDILRAVYVDEALKILSFEESKKYELYEYDLRSVEDTEAFTYEKCTEIQASMDLENGPLMKAALFTTDKGNYLFICIHHFAVDGVSWRILEEDLETAIKCQKEDRTIQLPEKTASFIEWADILNEYAESKELAKEKTYWSEVDEALKDKRLILEEANGEINRRTSFTLSSEVTADLLYEAGKAYNTQINDLLLAALSLAVKNVNGQDKIAVGIEGHGREPIHKEIRIDRTAGWFTSLYPVILSCCSDCEQTIIHTKDMIRAIPNHGLGYGILFPKPINDRVNVYFNYLGEMNDLSGNTGQVQISTGEDIAKENRFVGDININSLVSGGQFECTVTYNNCSAEFAERLADAYKEALTSVIGWCTGQDKGHATASDFSDSTLTNEELSEFDDMF